MKKNFSSRKISRYYIIATGIYTKKNEEGARSKKMSGFNLTVSVLDGDLHFVLSGRIASQNVNELSTMLTTERKNHPGGSVIFDCENLFYISSAGLRIFLSFNKKEQTPIKIINVSPEAYEIFDITGFTELFEVTKKLRDVSNADVKKMGYSGGVTVYYIGEDTLMKVYPEDTSFDEIEKERQNAQACMLFDIPTLIAYDIVTYKDRYGMLYELPKAHTVLSMIESSPRKLVPYAKEMGKLLKKLHSVSFMLDSVTSVSELYKSYARGMSAWLHPSEVEILVKLIDVIPESDTILYGNFTAQNVFVHQDDELILINMAGLQYGNPIFDLGRIYMRYKNKSDRLTRRMTGFEPYRAGQFWDSMMASYFGTNDISVLKQREKVIEAGAQLFAAIYPASYRATHGGKDLDPDDLNIFVPQARRGLFMALEHFALLLSSKELIINNN